ncbi:MAG: acetate kinase [Leptolyngbya sp. SIO4C1]|nr:acetate kinase [Leptolyngbya sp. SIO4C1]
MRILVLNAGSGSQKSSLFELAAASAEPVKPVWQASIDWTHRSDAAEMTVETASGQSLQTELSEMSRAAAVAKMLETLWSGPTQVIERKADIDAVGHRVVHGGQDYRQATRVDAEVKAAIDRLSALAPTHNPHSLAGIEAIEQTLGDVPQVVVFDTAFHRQIPEPAARYPLPNLEANIRRYGFHGTSHRYCTHRAAQLLDRPVEALRLIVCHLGNGCSLAAVRDGHSVDTTMGFTPLEGLMMGTRSGSIDPGILLYLMRQGYSVDRLDHLLNRGSGLKGVSGIGADLRRIFPAIDAGNHAAKLAYDMYIHRLRSGIGAMLANLDRLDALVFTGGVAQHQPNVRDRACAGLDFWGIELAADKNVYCDRDHVISADASPVIVLVIHTQEEWQIAQETYQLLTP